MKKRGMSNLITVPLLILLSLAAIVIFWFFIRGFLDKSEESSGFSAVETTLEIPSEEVKLISNTNVTFQVIRRTGDANIGALIIVLEGGGKSATLRKEDSLNILESRVYRINYTSLGIPAKGLNSISIIPVFVDGSGKEMRGNVLTKYTIKSGETIPIPPSSGGSSGGSGGGSGGSGGGGGNPNPVPEPEPEPEIIQTIPICTFGDRGEGWYNNNGFIVNDGCTCIAECKIINEINGYYDCTDQLISEEEC